MAQRLAVVDPDRCVGCQCCMFACSRHLMSNGLGSSRILIKSAGGIERGFVVIVCRACPEAPCAKVCPADALTVREGGGVHLDAAKCLGGACRLCQQACPFECVFWEETTDKPAICVYCGYCVDYCPYDVIKFEEAEVEVGRGYA